jgi:diguanylate cyclase (GGDEF)-like protein
MNIPEDVFANLPREVKVYISKLEYDLWHDGLTGVLSRKPFMEICEQELAFTKRLRTKGFALLFIDVNDFKIINDTHGHLSGDKVLKEIATRVRASVRTEDVVGRFGGDEFVILLRDVATKEESQPVIERLQKSMQLGIKTEASETNVGISGGVVFSNKETSGIEALLASADILMYKAKKDRDNSLAYFVFGE